MLPQTGAEAFMSYAPNVAFAGFTAANQPEGTDLLTRIGAGTEDLFGSLALQALGRGVGHGAVMGMTRVNPNGMSEGLAQAFRAGGEIGAETLGWGFVPRPFATAALQRYDERMTEQQQRELALRDEEIRRQALAEAGARGLLIPTGLAEGFYGGGGGYG